jgi:hypothetical protein
MARTPKNLVKPHIPEDTCPYIDMVQSLLDKMSEEQDYSWRMEQEKLARTLLEYVRESNQQLRTASKFWYDQYQKLSKN